MYFTSNFGIKIIGIFAFILNMSVTCLVWGVWLVPRSWDLSVLEH